MESVNKLTLQTTSTSPPNLKRNRGVDKDEAICFSSPDKMSKNEAMEDNYIRHNVKMENNEENIDENKENDPNSQLTESQSSSQQSTVDTDEILDAIKEETGATCQNPSRFNGYHFPHSSNLQDHMRDTFKLDAIRHNQLLPINAVILGHDCFVIMPSASGKSLIYQLPAVMASGVTIVISPLIALIKDQVKKLKSLGIMAEHVKGGSLNEEIFADLSAEKPKIKILYVTPEKIAASDFFVRGLKNLYKRNLLERIVVDEAQSIVQFGEGFREEYLTLHKLKDEFITVPWTLLTGTVTFAARQKIIDALHLNKYSIQLFASNIERPNLRYTVVDKQGATEIAKLINRKYKDMSGIVYGLYREEVDTLEKELKSNNISALRYHGGMNPKDRTYAQTKWMDNEVKVICGTSAFGMGIDKPNVRFIIHASLPRSIEEYCTDCGHAGRDGETADCILCYNEFDAQRYIQQFGGDPKNTDDIKAMATYCENEITCRRQLLSNHFDKLSSGEKCTPKKTTCDNCALEGENGDLN